MCVVFHHMKHQRPGGCWNFGVMAHDFGITPLGWDASHVAQCGSTLSSTSLPSTRSPCREYVLLFLWPFASLWDSAFVVSSSCREHRGNSLTLQAFGGTSSAARPLARDQHGLDARSVCRSMVDSSRPLSVFHGEVAELHNVSAMFGAAITGCKHSSQSNSLPVSKAHSAELTRWIQSETHDVCRNDF